MAIRHLVLVAFKAETTALTQQTLVQGFRDLQHQIPGIIGFEWGVNNSPEGLAQGLTHAFVVKFVDEASRDTYLPHPAHQAFVDQLKPWLADVLVVDYAC
jgi:quinol monooxygenase YgiN